MTGPSGDKGRVIPQGLREGKIVRPDGAVLYILRRTIEHMGAHIDVTFGLLRAAFERMDVSKEKSRLKEEIDFGRIVGRTSKVSTEAVSPLATSAFAYRRSRRYPSRIVLGIPKPHTSLLTLLVKRDRAKGEAAWELETAYLGSDAPLEPLGSSVLKGKPELQAKVMDFWCRHALVYEPGEYATRPFRSSWARLCQRRRDLGPDGFPEGGPYWMGDSDAQAAGP
jgi:hypothetical protein